MNAYYPHLFETFSVKGLTFRNRLFSAPNMICQMDENGYPMPDMIAYYAEKARGGAAVVTLGDTPVDREHAASNPRSFCLDYNKPNAVLPYLSEIAMAIHEGGAIASHELNHAGMYASPAANNGGEPIGPVDFYRDWDGVQVRAMTEKDMDEVAEHFACCAELLKKAGYDMCLIHGGHGWLLDQFLSPHYNKRTDEYGGSLENRAKFPLMVIDRVRERVGDKFLIEYRLSGCEELEDGLMIEEAVEFAKMIDGKVDFIHVSAGLDPEEPQAVHTHPTMFLPHGVNVKYAAAVKAAGVKTPVVTIGAINTPELAEQVLAEGKADIVAMARTLIADPHFPEKAAQGRGLAPTRGRTVTARRAAIGQKIVDIAHRNCGKKRVIDRGEIRLFVRRGRVGCIFLIDQKRKEQLQIAGIAFHSQLAAAFHIDQIIEKLIDAVGQTRAVDRSHIICTFL